jgi:hypothetical protein
VSARNRQKFESAQADRAAIDELLRARTQAEPLLTPKEILRLLRWPDGKLRTIQRHCRTIRATRLSDVQRHVSGEVIRV